MQKFTLILAFSLLCSTSAYSQKIYGVAIGGVAGTQVTGDNLVGYYKGGLILGLGAGFKFSNHLGFQMEMMFIQKGSRNPVDSIPNYQDPMLNYKMALSYIEVPFLLNYDYGKFRFQMGPSLAYLISAKETNVFGDIPSQVPFRKYDISSQVGAEYAFFKNLDLNIRFGYSLMSIRETSGFSLFNFRAGQFNSVVAFTLRYYIGNASNTIKRGKLY